MGTGLFSQAFRIPDFILLILNAVIEPSFFITLKSVVSTLSYVVNLLLHLRHSRLLLLDSWLSVSLLSITFVS